MRALSNACGAYDGKMLQSEEGCIDNQDVSPGVK